MSVLQRMVRNLAAQDYLSLCLHLYMGARLCVAQGGGAFLRSPVVWPLLICVLSLLLTRGEVLPPGPLRAVVYRLGLLIPAVLSYFTLQQLLPALHGALWDARFLRVDRWLFGETPALWLDPLVRPATVEWFSFFYYSYFFLLAVNVLGSALFDAGPRQREILMGAVVVVCVGHALYTLFPAYGPYATLSFPHPLRGGLFFARVQQAVLLYGAKLDVFPSLHTAYPTLFALHALRHRKRAPFRYVWPVSVFFAANIIVATLLLRWHYAIDIVAGLTLAVLAQQSAILAAVHENQRAAQGQQPVWEPV